MDRAARKLSAAIALILTLASVAVSAELTAPFGPKTIFGGESKILGVVPFSDVLQTAESCITVKYRDTCVPIGKFDCKKPQSSFVNDICYDASNKYMVILLKATWYHYCGIPQDKVTGLGNAESPGRYYNAEIKGKFGCQGQRIPSY